MSDNITILKIVGYGIVALAIIIGIYFVIHYPIPEAHGQSNTTLPKAVTSPPNPTPTTPNPNFQYLPQKAFVLPFAPENGIPVTPPLATPLSQAQVVPQQVPVQPVPVQNSTNILDQFGGVAGVLAMLGSAGVYVKTKFLDKNVKQTMAAEVKTKEQVGELARVSYENMPNKGNEITDAPAIKLETLKDDKLDFADKAAKA